MCEINWEDFGINLNGIAVKKGSPLYVLGSNYHSLFALSLLKDRNVKHVISFQKHGCIEFKLIIISHKVKDKGLIKVNVNRGILSLGLEPLTKKTQGHIDVIVLFCIDKVHKGSTMHKFHT